MTHARTHSRGTAVTMLLLATVYWGISFPLIKAITALNQSLFPAAGSWFVSAQALAPRFALAAVLLPVVQRRRLWRMSPAELGQGAAIGLFAAGGQLFQTDGLQFTSASTSAFLTQFSAILIPTWLALRHWKNPGWAVWTGCGLVLAGSAVLGRLNVRTLSLGRGEWETLLCSVFFMAQILWLNRPDYAGNRAGQVTFAMFATQALVFSGLSVATAPGAPLLVRAWGSGAWLVLTLVLTVVCTIGAFSAMNRWQPLVTATEAGLIYCVEPLFASVFALFTPALLSRLTGLAYPNERLSWTLVVGGGLITAANVLVLYHSGKAAEKAKSNR